MKPYLRRKARKLALQALYERLLSGNSCAEIKKHFLSEANEKKVDINYFCDLFDGVDEHLNDIDELMSPFLDRPLSALNPVELSVLRLAIFELSFKPDVPYRVVINEALELTKEFGAVEGFKFVNGVLDKVSKQCRKE